VISNHEDLRPMAEAAGLPFFHAPVTPATKRQAEALALSRAVRWHSNDGSC
jgi:formyltetrahydrofolate deformylase